jgi:hypothetical protein
VATAPLGILVTEPRGDLVARPVPEAALIAATSIIASPSTLASVIGPSGALVAIVTVVSHVSSFCSAEKAGRMPVIETREQNEQPLARVPVD